MRCITTMPKAVFVLLCIVGYTMQISATIAVSVNMKEDAISESNASKPRIYVTNTGTEVLNNFVYYYYFTTENSKTPVLEPYYLTSKEGVTLEPVASGYRVKYTVTNANLSPGSSLPSGGNYIGLHYNDWSAWDKTNDFSNNRSSSFQINQNIAVYVNNTKIYGNEPAPPAPPTAPTNLSTVPISKQRIDLSWTDNATTESGFKIERSTNSGSFSEVGTVGANVTSWQSTGLSANTLYSFRVRAYNSSGNSDYSNTSTETTHQAPAGFISFEKWNGITGTTVSTIPVSTTASTTGTLSILEESPQQGDNFGTRIRGYITAPVTGSYTFWIAGDNDCQLWISSNDLPANKVLRAEVQGYTSYQIWNKYTSQKSTSISLNEGTKYYVEILHKEGDQSDNCSVGWVIPGQSGSTVVVPGAVLSPYVTATIPAVPTGVSAVTLSSSLVNISWIDNNANETSYKLERATGSGSFSEIADLPANTTVYQNSGLAASTEYRYKLRACNGAGCSGYSSVTTAITSTQSPSNPPSLSLLSFAVYSNEVSKLQDRCSFSGGGAIGSNTYVEVGAQAVVNGNVVSGGSAYLRSASSVNGDVTVYGTVTRQDGSTISGNLQENASVAQVTIPEISSITVGTENKTIEAGQVVTVLPGLYNNLTVNTGGTVKLKAGTYTFSSIILWEGAHVIYDMSMYDYLEIFVKNQLDIYNNSDCKFAGTNTYAPAVRIYTNDPDFVYLGVNVKFTGILIAPHAEIRMYDGATCEGALYAKKILIEAVSSVNSGLVNPERDFDNDYVKTYSEYKLHTDPYNPLEYTAIGLPDYAMINNSIAQKVLYDFSRFFKGYSRATEVKGVFPANSLADPTSPILFQIRNMPTTAPEYNEIDYQPIGRYMEPVYNSLLTGGTVHIGMPLPDDILPGAQLKIAVYRGGAWEELDGTIEEQAMYTDITGILGPMILVQKPRDAVVYYDNAVYSSESMVKINVDLRMRGGTTTTTPPGTLKLNYTDYSSSSSGASGSKTLNLLRQADGSFTLKDILTFTGRVVVTSAILTVAIPDNVSYSISNTYDLAPGQSLTISNEKTITEIKGLPNIPDKLVFAYNTENLTFEYSSIASEGQIRKDGTSWSYNYYLKDHLGSTRMVINDDGEIVQALMYQPYGTTSDVPGMVSGSNDPLREKFTGKELDEDGDVNGAPGIGQIYFGFRFYDPELGVWMSIDPIKEYFNSYCYVGGNPIIAFDDHGDKTEVFFWDPVGKINIPGTNYRLGASGFGHVSVNVNGMNYSMSHSGMDFRSANEYIAKNRGFRGANVVSLDLSPEQESLFEQYLRGWAIENQHYDAVSASCLRPMEFALRNLGYKIGGTLLPNELLSELMNISGLFESLSRIESFLNTITRVEVLDFDGNVIGSNEGPASD